MMGVPPSIENSTREERLAFVQHGGVPDKRGNRLPPERAILGRCRSFRFNGRTLCMLHGQNAEDAYTEYITGQRSYMDITLELRR